MLPTPAISSVLLVGIVVGKAAREAWSEGRVEFPTQAQVHGQLLGGLPFVLNEQEQLVAADGREIAGGEVAAGE